jgi:two-component system sensor histidine kinase KdpD
VSADVRPQGSAARGRLRIYLGYAPGAGTTCALLSEGRRRAEHGTDVVVASAETHGRRHTEDLLAGLEVIPSVKVPYRGTLAEEMDLGAVLARGPAVALVDDFAHRNAPGSRHRARWQDVEDLLAAGIDVISAVGAGHLDSLADVVAKITGAAPRQTVPDPVVRAAGEVELVDVAPEALRDRLARGHIYPADQVEAALGGWFQTGNLSALRELALLWLAATLAGGPQRHLPGGGDPGSGQARERVVVALSGGPEGETLIRRAARIAARSGGELLAVHAARPGRPACSGRAVLASQRRPRSPPRPPSLSQSSRSPCPGARQGGRSLRWSRRRRRLGGHISGCPTGPRCCPTRPRCGESPVTRTPCPPPCSARTARSSSTSTPRPAKAQSASSTGPHSG